ncbi:MAG: hypothetical protein ABI337_04250 [Nitrososphaera sp.]|jgi:hypothetical protein
MGTVSPQVDADIGIQAQPICNDCERVLREAVIHRKVRGLFRNGKGMRRSGNIMTVFMTWKLRGLNPLVEIRKYL